MNVALDKLDILYDRLIIKEYMKRTKVNRFKLISELSLSEGDYYRKRNSAFFRFARVLGIEVYDK